MKKGNRGKTEFCYNRMVVMGGSAGGFDAFYTILSALSPNFKWPVLMVQHLHVYDDGMFSKHLARSVSIPVSEPLDKELIQPGHVYVAPADYHMLVERDGTIALSTEEKVNWSRPSIDALFESAALAFGDRVIAIIVTGASNDGSSGIKAIKAVGGLTIAQDPLTAEHPYMPKSSVDTGAVDLVMTVEAIGKKLVDLGKSNSS